ncbi:MAG: YlxR family protein [Tissierellia bacterium]|nr:YlxR family protein [Tissierellia bacterium]
MKKVKKIPMRKCVGCQENKSKKELIRIVKNKEGEIFVDQTGKANGRGAYICLDIQCFEKAKKSNSLQRALGAKISEETFQTLKDTLNK